jgi:hypothetical protein
VFIREKEEPYLFSITDRTVIKQNKGIIRHETIPIRVIIRKHIEELCYERIHDQGTLGSIAIAIVEPLGGKGGGACAGILLAVPWGHTGSVSRDRALDEGAQDKGAGFYLKGLLSTGLQ